VSERPRASRAFAAITRALPLAAVLASAMLLAVCPASADPQTGKITIVATGFGSEKGEVLVQLANSQKDYDEDDDGFRMASVKPAGGRATIVFEDVPYGEYAIKLFHDENSNRKLDIGWTGPEERYGFSNNERGLIGPPAFEKVRFELSAPEKNLEIAVK